MDITTLETVNLGDLAEAMFLGFFTLGILAYAGLRWVLR